jgi:hypothetical protein
MAHTQKPNFVFHWNGRVHLNWQGRQFSRLLAAKVCTSAVVMLDTPCYEVVWRVLATHSIRQFPLHFPFCASPCAITFQLESTTIGWLQIFKIQVENCLENTSTSDHNNGKWPSRATWYGNELPQLVFFTLDYTRSAGSFDSRLWKFSVYRAPKIDLHVKYIRLESRH